MSVSYGLLVMIVFSCCWDDVDDVDVVCVDGVCCVFVVVVGVWCWEDDDDDDDDEDDDGGC